MYNTPIKTEYSKIMTLEQIIQYLRNGRSPNTYAQIVVKIPTIKFMINSLQIIRKQLTYARANELKKIQKQKQNETNIKITQEFIIDSQPQYQNQEIMQENIRAPQSMQNQGKITQEELSQINQIINKIQRGGLSLLQNITQAPQQKHLISILGKSLTFSILSDYERLYQIEQNLRLIVVKNNQKESHLKNLLTENCLQFIRMIKQQLQYEMTQEKINKIHDIYAKLMRGQGETAANFLSSLQKIEKIPFLKKLLKPIQIEYGMIFKIFNKLKNISGYQNNQTGFIVGPKLTDECVKCLELMTNSKELNPIFNGLCQLYYPKKQHYLKLKPEEKLMTKCQWLIEEIQGQISKYSNKLCHQLGNYQLLNNKNIKNLLYLCDLCTNKQHERISQIISEKQQVQIKKKSTPQNCGGNGKTIKNLEDKKKNIQIQLLEEQIREKQYKDIKLKLQLDIMLHIRNQLIIRIKDMSSQGSSKVIQIYENAIVDQISDQSVYIITISLMLKQLAYVMELKSIKEIFQLAKLKSLFYRLEQKRRADSKIFKNISKIKEDISQEQELINIVNQIIQESKNKESNSSILQIQYREMMGKFNLTKDQNQKLYNQLTKIKLENNNLQQKYKSLSELNQQNGKKIKQYEQKSQKIVDKKQKMIPYIQFTKKQQENKELKKLLNQKKEQILSSKQQTQIELKKLQDNFNIDREKLTDQIKDQQNRIKILQQESMRNQSQKQKLIKLKNSICKIIGMDIEEQEKKISEKVTAIKLDRDYFEQKFNKQLVQSQQIEKKQKQFINTMLSKLMTNINQKEKKIANNKSQILEDESVQKDEIQKHKKQILLQIDQKLKLIQNKKYLSLKNFSEQKLKIESYQKSIKILQKENTELKQNKVKLTTLSDQKHQKQEESKYIKQMKEKNDKNEKQKEDLKKQLELEIKNNQDQKVKIVQLIKENQLIKIKFWDIYQELENTRGKINSLDQLNNEIRSNKQILSQISNCIGQKNAQVQAQTQKLSKISQQIQDKATKVKQLKEEQLKLQQINQQISLKEEKLKQLIQRQEQISQQSIQTQQKKLHELLEKIKLVNQQYESKNNEFQQLLTQMKDKYLFLENFDRIKEQKCKQVQSLEKNIIKSKLQLQELEGQITDGIQKIKQISQYKIEYKQQKIEQLKQEINVAIQQIQSKEKYIKDKKQQLQNIQIQIRESELLRNKNEEYFINLKNKIQEIQSKFTIQESNLKNIQRRLQQIKLEDVDGKQKLLEELKDKISKRQEQIIVIQDNIKQKEYMTDEKNKKLQLLQSQQQELQQKMNKMREEIKQIDKILLEKQQKLKILQQRFSNISEQKLRQKQLQFSRFDQKIKLKQRQIQEKVLKLSELQNSIIQKEQKLKQIEFQAEEKSEQVSKMNKYIKQQEISLQKLQERLKKISQPQLKQKQTKLQNILKQYQTKLKQLEQIRVNAQNQRQAIFKIKKENSQNTELSKKNKQQIKKQNQILKQLFDKILQNQKENKKKVQQAKKIQERQKKARTDYEKYQKQFENLKKQQELIIQMKNQFQQTSEKKLILQSQITQLRKNIRLEEQQRNKINQQKTQISNSIKKLNKELEQKKYEKSNLSLIQQQIKQKNTQKQDLDQRVKYLTEEIKKLTNYLSEKQKIKQNIQDSIKQFSQIQNKLEQSINKKRNQNLKFGGFSNRFFIGEVLEEEADRQFIIDEIYKLYPKRQIEKTKLLYTYPLMKDMNPHLSVDKCPHYIVVMKLEQKNKFDQNYILALYSQRPLEYKMALNDGPGFVCAVTNRKSFYLRKNTSVNPRLTQYNQFYFLFGNSQFRFRINSDKIEVNVGHNFRSLDTGDMKTAQFFTGRNQDIHPIINYQFYQIMFKN